MRGGLRTIVILSNVLLIFAIMTFPPLPSTPLPSTHAGGRLCACLCEDVSILVADPNHEKSDLRQMLAKCAPGAVAASSEWLRVLNESKTFSTPGGKFGEGSRPSLGAQNVSSTDAITSLGRLRSAGDSRQCGGCRHSCGWVSGKEICPGRSWRDRQESSRCRQGRLDGQVGQDFPTKVKLAQQGVEGGVSGRHAPGQRQKGERTYKSVGV